MLRLVVGLVSLFPASPVPSAFPVAGAKHHGKSPAVASWLAANGQSPKASPLPHTPQQHRPTQRLHRQASLGLRRSDSLIQRPPASQRIVHADWRGITDSLLPILRPDSRGKKAWDLLIMVVVVWTVITVPLSVSYGMPDTGPWNSADHVMTALFGLDLLINFRTAFYNHQVRLSWAHLSGGRQ
jgi:hypothetical protein